MSAPPALARAPRFLVGAGLLAWGWQNDYLLFAVPMAVLLEASSRVAWRWPVSSREFNQVSDLSSAIFLVTVIYVFGKLGSKGIFLILAIMPFVLYLLLLAQYYSVRGRMPLSALFISLRRLDPVTSPESRADIDLSYPYLATCLVAASAGNREPVLFFGAACMLLGLALYAMRPHRYHAFMFAVMLLLATGAGYAGQIGMVQLQYAVESRMMDIFDRFLWRFRDPNLATTAIGSIGRLKLSDRIVLRVRPDQPIDSPMLLREASYDSYRYGIWSNRNYAFASVDPDVTGNLYPLGTGPSTGEVSISTYFLEQSSILPLPVGVTRLRRSGATGLSRNTRGAVRMDAHAGWVAFTADFGPEPDRDAPPTARDLAVPDSYRADFLRVSEGLGLAAMPPPRVLAAVKSYFARNFTYSLTWRERYPRGRYLSAFLFDTHSGHCEFFATATVLLLRAAGIPARYVVGYAIDEYSALEGQYVGRARHAHAWAQAWVNGAWRVIDTTPPVWVPLEAEKASSFESIYDLFSWVNYRLSRWQSRDAAKSEEGNGILLWLLVPLVLWLAWRLYSRYQAEQRPATMPTRATRTSPGMDSGFFQLVAALETRGFIRRPGETLPAWLERLRDILDPGLVAPALSLHYRYRFDPAGLSPAERQHLESRTREILQSLAG